MNYTLIEMDLLSPQEQQEAGNEVRRWNPSCNYPVLVLHAERAILGYREDEIRKELG